ncbi:hypothetical protein NC651_035235 [Populus alba x Populus x berolinensis]|nr:hypothetical protein NC651_035235 [Populus alba x Populus x berolinensis]
MSLKAALMLILTNLKTFFQLLMFQMRKQKQDGKHVLEEKGAASDASSPRSSLKELQDKKEDI